MFRTMSIAASGLSAQRQRMEIIATNIANAETTRTPAGGPYRRRVVQMEAATAEDFKKSLEAAKESADAGPASAGRTGTSRPSAGRTVGDANTRNAAAARVLGASARLNSTSDAEDRLSAADAAFEKKLNAADQRSGLAADEADKAQGSQAEGWGVKVSAIVEDATEGPLVYDPAHPDADANGYVRYPNVRITDELVDMMDAKRMYEANATVFQAAKQMLRRAIDI